MIRSRLSPLNLAPVLFAGALLFGVLAAPTGPARVAVAILAVTGTLLTLAAPLPTSVRGDATLVRQLLLLGMGARLALFGFVHQSVGPYFFAPDQRTYERWGRGLFEYFTADGVFPQQMGDSLQLGYPLMNAVLYGLFGEVRAGPAVVNMLLSVWTAVVVYALTMSLCRGDRARARLAMGLALFFPSAMLWSVLGVREAPTTFLLTLSVFLLVRFQQRGHASTAMAAVVTVASVALFREYLMLLVAVAGVAGITVGRSRSPLRSLIVGSVMLFGVTYAAQVAGLGGSLAQEPTLERAQLLRESFQLGAGSAYGQGADVSTPVGALLYAPVGLAYFLLAPFPWEVTSALQITALPEVLIWWAFFPFVVWGVLRALRRYAGTFTVPLLVLGLITFSYALVESNVGTAFRHRSQLLPVAFVFGAMALRALLDGWQDRRRRRAERRRRVTRSFAESLGGPGAGTRS